MFLTLNAFKVWLMTDEATRFLEDRWPSMVLERWLRDADSLRRRERISKRCISVMKNDEGLKDISLFGSVNEDGDHLKCLLDPDQASLGQITFGRLVDNLPEVDDLSESDIYQEERQIVRELFRVFVERRIRLFINQELGDMDDRLRSYSSVMLYIESLPCAYPREEIEERRFVISFSYSGSPQQNNLPWAYKTAKAARVAVEHLAELVIPHGWARYKFVIGAGRDMATLTNLDDHTQEFTFHVNSISVPKDRLIPIDSSPVEDWGVARARSWDTRNYTMAQWLDKLNPTSISFEGSGAERSAASERYASKCDWWKFDFTQLDNWKWILVLRHRPDLIDQCPCLDEFSDKDWCLLLRRQPQFADRFNRWDDLSPSLLCFLLRRQPQFAEMFTNWDGFDAYCWARLLKDQPQFSNRCPWEILSGNDWKELLISRPEFASQCDWGKLSPCDWHELLYIHPEFEDNCDWKHFHWDDISEEQWLELIERWPIFIQRADSTVTIWRKISAANWVRILTRHPDLIVTCKEQFSGWEGLNVKDFLDLTTLVPGLVERCDWTCQWTADEQVEILIKRPELAQYVLFEAFSSENWVVVLTSLPALADRCDWHIFSEQELVSIIKQQEELLRFVPRGRIVSRRAWIDLSTQFESCKKRFIEELDVDPLDGRAITDILLELPELADRLPTDRITDEIDKKRLMLLQPELAEKIFGREILANCWSDSFQWKGRDGIVLGVCVKGDLFSLPQTGIGRCDGIIVMTIRNRSKEILQSYENWRNLGLPLEVVLEEVPAHHMLNGVLNKKTHYVRDLDLYPNDDQQRYNEERIFYSIDNSDVEESLDRGFSRLSNLGVRSVAINGIDLDCGRGFFQKLIKQWFEKNGSSISVVYLVDKEDANAFKP